MDETIDLNPEQNEKPESSYQDQQGNPLTYDEYTKYWQEKDPGMKGTDIYGDLATLGVSAGLAYRPVLTLTTLLGAPTSVEELQLDLVSGKGNPIPNMRARMFRRLGTFFKPTSKTAINTANTIAPGAARYTAPVNAGAEFAYKAESLRPGFNKSIEDFFSQDLGEAMFLKESPADLKLNAFTTQKKSIFEELYPGTAKARRELRERIFSPEGSEYRDLVTKHQRILENIEPTMVDGNLVKISPIPEEELIKHANRLIQLKEQLNIPSPKVYQRELGAVIKDEHVARITGGQASSNKIGQFQSTKPFYDRAAREDLWPVEGDPWEGLFGDKNNPRRVAARQASTDLPKELRTIEADHMNILETTTPWGQVKNTKGEWVPRSEKQLLELRDIMKSKYNVDLGNINENWMMASTKAHRTGDLAKHVTLGSVTDFQKPLVYADADKIQVVLKNGKTKWLTQIDGQLFDGKTLVKKGNIKKKLNLELNGRQYTPTQKHGASLQLQDTLAAITDTEELADAMKLFMIDSGANEVMKGATVLSSYAYDSAKHLDPLTLKLRQENIPAMIDYIDLLLDTPQYKGHRILHDLKERFTNRMSAYKEQLRLRGS